MPSQSEKGQALLFVFLVLLIVAVLSETLSKLWRNFTEITTLERDTVRAFYIAEAGIERARISLANDANWTSWTGVSNVSLANGSYSIAVTTSGAQRVITATGQYGDTRKQIRVNVQAGAQEILDANGTHYGYRNSKVANTWQEQ